MTQTRPVNSGNVFSSSDLAGCNSFSAMPQLCICLPTEPPLALAQDIFPPMRFYLSDHHRPLALSSSPVDHAHGECGQRWCVEPEIDTSDCGLNVATGWKYPIPPGPLQGWADGLAVRLGFRGSNDLRYRRFHVSPRSQVRCPPSN